MNRAWLVGFGLDPTKEYTLSELKKQFRKLSKEYHPDKENGNAEKFKSMVHSYKMLTDASYNRDSSGWEQNLTFTIQRAISFSDAFFGTSFVVSYSRVTYDKAYKPIPASENLETISFTVNVQPGSNHPFQWVQSGAGIKMGDSIGHAVVIVHPQPHPKFSVVGVDVVSRELIPLDIMLTGGTIEVLTMWGLKTLKIIPGTKPGDKVPLPKSGVDKIGAHFVIVEPIYPGEEDLRKEKWHGLEVNWGIKDEIKSDEDFLDLFDRIMKSGIV